MDIRWEDGFAIGARIDDGTFTLTANREGLVSLAHILLDLADQPPGTHVHLDEYNSLDDGSVEMIIERA